MTTVLSGLDVLLRDGCPLLEGRRIGLITNHTGVNRHLDSIIDLLHGDERFHIERLFAAEHGVRGDLQAGAPIVDTTDPNTGLPVVSLYGDTRKPTPEMLAGLDVLLFDAQDVGVRFWTYIGTMIYGMEAAAGVDLPYVVIDRPNPITGTHREGPLLDQDYISFVGMYDMPTRTGVTMGEHARIYAADHDLPEPTVIACDGWRRSMWWEETGLPFVQASPNVPTMDSLICYAGTCIFEATTMSEGRGTTRPFEYIGAPWVDSAALVREMRRRGLPGVAFRDAAFVPMFSKHQGDTCRGVQLHVLDRDAMRPVELGVHLIHAFKHLPGSEFVWRPGGALGMSANLLYGSPVLHTMIDDGAEPEDIIETWPVGMDGFVERATRAALYT